MIVLKNFQFDQFLLNLNEILRFLLCSDNGIDLGQSTLGRLHSSGDMNPRGFQNHPPPLSQRLKTLLVNSDEALGAGMEQSMLCTAMSHLASAGTTVLPPPLSSQLTASSYLPSKKCIQTHPLRFSLPLSTSWKVFVCEYFLAQVAFLAKDISARAARIENQYHIDCQ